MTTALRNPGGRVIAVAWAAMWLPTFILPSLADDRPREWTPDLMMTVKQVGNVVPSPDGRRVAFTVRQAVMTGDKSEYLTHVHVANIDGSGSRQLTRGDKSCDSPQWSPDGSSIAFLSARVGKTNVWLIPIDGGEAELVTDFKSGVAQFKRA